MASRVREGLLLVVQGMFMKTFISAAQEKETSVSRVVQPGSVHGKEACLSGQWDARGLAGPTQLARVDIIHRSGDRIVAWKCRNCKFSSCLASHILWYLFLFLLLYV